MSKDAKAAERQRLAEALRANLRRRKATQGARAVRPAPEHEADAAPKPAPDGDR